jgi:23S rRNA (guanine745-N1)-methyltransferase
MGRMLADIVTYLICPVCRADVDLAGGALRCAQGHAFDVAKQGYVSLLVGSRAPGTADSPEMVAARAAFLDAGHYAPLANALAETVRGRLCPENGPEKHETSTESSDAAEPRAYRGAGVQAGDRGAKGRIAPVIVDAGAGTGHYLAAVLNAVNNGIGMAFDVSKHAVRRAARAHPRLGAFVADVWRPLPIRHGVADVVIDVFAPRNGPEFRRILRPGGAAIVATPSAAHLSPLVEELGLLSVDEEKDRRVARSMEGFAQTGRHTIEFDMELGQDEITQVVGMGPSAWHTDPADLTTRISGYIGRNAIKGRKTVTVSAAFHLSIFEPEPRSRPVP